METWQCLFIKSNLPELVDITLCNTALLTRLYAQDVLSSEEYHEIDVTQNKKRKASKLYEILVTRTNAYHLLICACKATKQTGVAAILEDGESRQKLPNENKCDASHNSHQTKKSSEYPTVHNPPFPKTGFLKPKQSNFKTNVLHNLIRHQQKDLSEIKDKPITKDFQRLTNNLQNKLQESLGVCHNTQSDTKFTAVSNSNVSKKSNATASPKLVEKKQQQSEFIMKISDKRTSHISKCDLNESAININQPDSQGCTSLHKALADGQSLDDIKSLIENKADYRLKDNSEQGVLHFAVRGGNKEVLNFLLSLNLNSNEVDKLGQTPMHKVIFAKNRNYLEMTQLLLDKGADLCAKDKSGDNIAHWFGRSENISSADFQIWAEGILNIGSGQIFAQSGFCGRTPLQTAMVRLDLDLTTVKLILGSSKVNLGQQDYHGYTLLHFALEFGRSLETVTNLIALGANTKINNKYGNRGLHSAVIGGNKEVIQYFISLGFDVNEKNNCGNAPLHFVSFKKRKSFVELTKLLLDNGANLYSKNARDETLAHEMAVENDVSHADFKIWVAAMIKNGHARLFTIRGFNGRTPLHSSMLRLDLELETMKLIIESSKLDINQPDGLGNTILHIAVDFGRSLDTIKNLVKLGADWKRKGLDDCNVLHFAVSRSKQDALLYFKSLGADVNTTDKYGRTPLHYVATTKNKDYLGMTKFLLENGANINAKTFYGDTLHYLMSFNKDISAGEFRVWQEGMTKLDHSALFTP